MAATTTGDDDTASEGPDVTVDVEHLTAGDTLRYELVATDVGGYDRLSFVFGQHVRVVETAGLEAVRSAGRTMYRQVGTADRVRIVVQPAVASADDGPHRQERFATDRWMLGAVPFAELQWRRSSSAPLNREYPLRDHYGAVRDEADATYGDRYAFVGSQDVQTHRANGQEFSVVSPAGTDIAPDHSDLESALAAASRQLDVGDTGDSVLLFALPSPARRGGESFPVHDEAWVHASSPLNDPNSVWLHEYVHTRQDFHLATDMRWFREASAEYYAARLAYRQDRVSETAVRSHLGGEARSVPLTDSDTWSDARVAYTKGARVLALLDRNIRAATNDRRSLEDVFRRLNRHDGKVTYEVFTDAVAAVVGYRMDGWLDRYVAGSEPVASIYERGPRQSILLAPVQAAASVGGSSGVFLFVTALFSAVASLPTYAYLARRRRRRLAGERPGTGGRSY